MELYQIDSQASEVDQKKEESLKEEKAEPDKDKKIDPGKDEKVDPDKYEDESKELISNGLPPSHGDL